MRPSKTASHILGLTTKVLDSAVRNLDNARRIANFLRGAADFDVRADDVFVSSYPRSGTTLTQWIVYLATNGQVDEHAPHLTQLSPWFERSLAIGDHTASTLEAVRSPRVFKSHLPRNWLPDGAKYIYVARDGHDVLSSYFHFYRDYLGFNDTFDAFYRRFMSGRVQYGSWFDHVESWNQYGSDQNVLLLQYEALLHDRTASVERICDFLRLNRTDGEIGHIVHQSSFEAMKARESMFDHATALLLERGVNPKSFIRAGKVGAGRDQLNEMQLQEFTETASSGRPLAIRGLAAFLQ
ncbi:MAG: sulfotransferase domain-containing protein [Polyangiales bacterium]